MVQEIRLVKKLAGRCSWSAVSRSTAWV